MNIPAVVPCAISPADKRSQAKRVGDELVRKHGKRKFYTVQQVKDANQRAGVNFDAACWSHAMFNTHAEFDRMHSDLGGSCDYAAMKAQMLEAVAADTSSSTWFDWDLSWLEYPDIDFSIFDVFD